MSYPGFLKALLETGRVQIEDAERPSNAELEAGDPALSSLELEYRRDLPGSPPEFSIPAARWAANRMFRTAQFILFREVSTRVVEDELSEPFPNTKSPTAIYSVDFTFRFLPDFFRLSKSESSQDVLTQLLLRLSAEWPLSSVGVPEVDDSEPDTILTDPCLRMLYLDRILSTSDHARLKHAGTLEVARSVCGLYPELAGRLAKYVSPQHSQDNQS